MSSVSDTYQIKINARKRGSYDQIPFVVYYRLDNGGYNFVKKFRPNDTFTDYIKDFTIYHRNYHSITVIILNNDDGNSGDRSNIFDKIELFLLNSTTNTYSSNILGDPNLILNSEYSNGDNPNYNYITDGTITTITTIGSWKLRGSTIAEKGPSDWNTGITNETLILQDIGSQIEQNLNVLRTYDSTTSQVSVDYINAYTNNNTNTVYYTRLPQSNLIFNGLLSSYSYGATIEFDVSGGSGTGAVTYAVNHDTFGQIPVVDNKITQDISASEISYTVIATKYGDTNYNDISATESFIIQKGNQSNLIFNGLLSSYSYGATIEFDVSGGSGTGTTVTYTVEHPTFGPIPVEDDKITQDISADFISYRVTATKSGDTNYYAAISATESFIIQKGNQSNLIFNGLLSSYSYGATIEFAVSGGSGTGAVTYVVEHPTFGQIPVVGDTLSQDISADFISYTVIATKSGDTNYNPISATDSFIIQKSDQDQLDLSGVRPFYYYGDTIEFDVSGGSGTGDVSYTVIHPVFGSIPVEDDKITQDISVAHIYYIVTATKDGDTNYNAAISAREYFTVQKSDQDQLDLSGVRPFYYYGDTIEFDVSGGSGTGTTVTYTVEHPTFGPIPVVDNKITQDISASEISYTVIATKDGDTNYNDISATEYFTVQKSDQDQLDLSGVRSFYSYGATIEFDVSGGSGTGAVTYIVEHTTFGSIPVVGDKITQDISASEISYTVIAFKDGDANYNDISATEYFTVQKGNQDQLDLSGVRPFYYYGDTIEFDVSGGSGTGAVTYTVEHPTFGSIPVVGDTLSQDISATDISYTVTATKSGDTNYYAAISATEYFTVQKGDQSSFTITNDISYVFVENQTIDITTEGGSIVSDVSITINDISSTQLVNPNVDNYRIIAVKSGNVNYKSIQDSMDIEITKASQDPLTFTSQSQYEYSPNQEIVLTAFGGSGNGLITFNIVGEQTNVTKLMNPNTGSYVIEIHKAGSLNYYPTSDTMTIAIIKAPQQNLVNETIIKTTYNPELVIDLVASGGTTTNPIHFTMDGTQITQLIHPNAGTYSIVATKSGNENYKDISLNFEITVDKSPQDIMTVNPSTVNYALSSNTVQLTISGGSTDSEPIITFQRNSMNIDENYIVEYDRPDVLLIDIDKGGNENYLSLNTQLRFEVVKNMDYLKNTLHIPPRTLLENPYINVLDVIRTYTVNELLEDGYSLRELQTMGITACAVFNTGKYTILDLKRAGYKIKICAR